MRCFLLFLVLILAGCADNSLPPLGVAKERKREFTIVTRVNVASYSVGEGSGPGGFDYDLVERFARELGIETRIVVAASDRDILNRLQNDEADLAAAWQTPGEDAAIRASTPYFESRNVLVMHEATLPPSSVAELAHKRIHVVAGSRQEAMLREIARSVAGIEIVPSHKLSELDLMEGVATHQFEAALVNNAEFDIGSNYYPELQAALEIGPDKPIVWLFGPRVAPEVIAKANAFLLRMQADGDMDRLKDRYFGHVDRLTSLDSVRFIEGIRYALPTYRAWFQTAQASTGIDWRILAALSYQESQWNPLATSPTGVRGMMMLTEDTADTYGVSNRLDPQQSIRAGAEFLNGLRASLPPQLADPDRLWLALAAYNLGQGHLNAARYIAKTLKMNPDSWYEMKKVLPLLAKERYYKRLKSGKGRGGEAVIMVENIRMYVDILKRYERAYQPTGLAETPTTGRYRPLRKLDDVGVTLGAASETAAGDLSLSLMR